MAETDAVGAVTLEPDPGSFRDPAGRIFRDGDHILRAISRAGIDDWTAVRESGLLDRLANEGLVVASDPIGMSATEGLPDDTAELVRHPRLPFISYPFEWGFEALKSAALHHLDVHLAALRSDITLVDASAYNVQFVGTRPIFIDVLSFRPYVPGRLWDGYRQFCEQFLYPLLLESIAGVNANPWYRGTIEGLSARDVRRVLPMRSRLVPGIWKHVILPDVLGGTVAAEKQEDAARQLSGHGIPKAALIKLLQGLKSWIEKLSRRGSKTTWDEYSSAASYNERDGRAKHEAVSSFVSAVRPNMLWDIGCNRGEFALTACEAGAKYVVGWDFDAGAIDQAFRVAQDRDAPFTPLLIDVANPTPSQGWAQAERPGMAERGPADALMALALVHHLAIGRNVPLPSIVSWLTQQSKVGLIEFVPKSDPQVKRMLAFRHDIFPNYDKDNFANALSQHARIERTIPVGDGGRELYWFDRT